MHGGGLVAAASDDGDREILVVFDGDGVQRRLTDLDTGRVVELAVSPTGPVVALTNHRNELLLVDVRGAALKRLDHSPFGRIEDPAWIAVTVTGE